MLRSSSKLESLLPVDVSRRIEVIQGNAKHSDEIRKAIVDTKCDAVINTAGVAALAPWGKSDLPEIFRAVYEAVKNGSDRKTPLRVWFLGGLGVLYYPDTESMLSNYVPIFLEHRQNIRMLRSTSTDTIQWSMLCPSTIVPESTTLSVPSRPSAGPLIACGGSPPQWQYSWVRRLPLIGRSLEAAMNASRYETTLEQNAEFIAGDLDNPDSQWIGTTVGVISEPKK
ncbi:hypothetical protein Q7P37_001777 [Cladosporium fusiforme]